MPERRKFRRVHTFTNPDRGETRVALKAGKEKEE